MAEGFVLSKRDMDRVQRLLREHDSNTDTRYHRRRHNGRGAIGSTGGSDDIRRAFVRVAPGATAILQCWLDAIDTGEEIEVDCTIYPGGNLNEAHPVFTVFTPLWVKFDTVNFVWINVTTISGIDEECI